MASIFRSKLITPSAGRVIQPKNGQRQTIRLKSTSLYGRSHLKKGQELPNPVVPHFKQRVFLSDGSSFTHFTTSPRTTIRLTRDMANNPFWSPGSDEFGSRDDESGRMGRFKKRFAGTQEDGEIDLDKLAKDTGIEVKAETLHLKKWEK